MSSSTSSFRHELPVWLAVVATMLAGEAAIRLWGTRLSDNLSRIDAIPQQADIVSTSPARPRILMLGNSLTINGLEKKAVDAEAARQWGHPVTIETIAFHGAELTEWYWMLDQEFARVGKMPDAIVINLDARFAEDFSGVRTRRLSHYFPLLSNPFVPTEDLPSFEQWGEFTVAKLSQSYSRAKGLASIAMQRGIPHYEVGKSWVDRQIAAAAERRASNSPLAPPTYERLTRTVTLARAHNAEVYCVLMPHRADYEISAELTQLLAQQGVTVVDLRHVDGIGPAQFIDRQHLTPEGAHRFTPEYLRRLAAAMQRG